MSQHAAEVKRRSTHHHPTQNDHPGTNAEAAVTQNGNAGVVMYTAEPLFHPWEIVSDSQYYMTGCDIIAPKNFLCVRGELDFY